MTREPVLGFGADEVAGAQPATTPKRTTSVMVISRELRCTCLASSGFANSCRVFRRFQFGTSGMAASLATSRKSFDDRLGGDLKGSGPAREKKPSEKAEPHHPGVCHQPTIVRAESLEVIWDRCETEEGRRQFAELLVTA